MTINLEKELIRSNKKLATPSDLLLIKEYENNAGLVDDDSLSRVGLTQTLSEGRKTKKRIDNLLQETKKFDQSRVFHISQIEDICNKYYLRFLPSIMYRGTIDSQLPYKINAFEAAYQVKCQCDWVPNSVMDRIAYYGNLFNKATSNAEPIQNTFIVAPASSFKLEEMPKDPLFFYRINEEYFYLIHKWGNDLNLSRRLLSLLSGTRNTLILSQSVALILAIIGISLIVFTGVRGFGVLCFISLGISLWFLISAFTDDDFALIRKNRWNSPYLD